MVVDGGLTAPARVTAGQIRFTVAVAVKQFGDFRVFQLFNIGDVVFLSGFLVNQIPLSGVHDIIPFAVEFIVTSGRFVLGIVQRHPAYCHKGGITVGD